MKKLASRIIPFIVAVCMLMFSGITASAEYIRIAGGLYDTESYAGETKFLVEDSGCVRAGYWNIYPDHKFGLEPYEQELTERYPFTVKEVYGDGWYRIYFGPVETDEAYIFVTPESLQKFFYILYREEQPEETTQTTTTTTAIETTTESVATTSTEVKAETTAITTTEAPVENTTVTTTVTTQVTTKVQTETTVATEVTTVETQAETTVSGEKIKLPEITIDPNEEGWFLKLFIFVIWYAISILR